MKQKKLSNNSKEFLNTFFEKEEYTEKQVNGFWLIKRYNGANNSWEVAIYKQEAYTNYKKANLEYKERGEQISFLNQI
jgi:hypothetical protein